MTPFSVAPFIPSYKDRRPYPMTKSQMRWIMKRMMKMTKRLMKKNGKTYRMTKMKAMMTKTTTTIWMMRMMTYTMDMKKKWLEWDGRSLH